MATVKPDFKIVSNNEEFNVSRHLMSVNCKLFDRDYISGSRYETYLPVPRAIMQTFIDCVYGLVLDAGSVKSKITADNFHLLALLCEEFHCPALNTLVTQFAEERRKARSESALVTIRKLEEALRRQEGEMAAQLEGMLAADLDNTLKNLQRIPISRIPIAHLHRILERGLKDRESVNEGLLCDFVLSKVEESADACVLVDLIRVDRLPLEQAQKLFEHKKLQGWYFNQFPIHFVQELLRNVNTRLAAIEESVEQKTRAAARLSPRSSPRRVRTETCDVETETMPMPMATAEVDQLQEELKVLKDDFYKHYHLPGFKVPRCPSLLHNHPYRGKAFDGIIAYLNGKYGSNLHDRGIVEVTSSGSVNDEFHEKFILDLEDKRTDFCSRSMEGAWFCIDFKDRRIMPLHYSIRTFVFGPGSTHLRSWAVEISKTGEDWIEIDRRVNTDDLNGIFSEKTYEVEKPEDGEFRFIRLKMIDRNHSGSYDLVCSAFEVFGALFE